MNDWYDKNLGGLSSNTGYDASFLVKPPRFVDVWFIGSEALVLCGSVSRFRDA